jgi:hypothetical protein
MVTLECLTKFIFSNKHVRNKIPIFKLCDVFKDAIGCLVVSMIATGPMGLAAVGSDTAEEGGFLRMIKNP